MTEYGKEDMLMQSISGLIDIEGEKRIDETDESKPGFSEYQKSIVVRSTLERYIKKSLERNMFRYGKISERDDDEWYHTIKTASINESESR